MSLLFSVVVGGMKSRPFFRIESTCRYERARTATNSSTSRTSPVFDVDEARLLARGVDEELLPCDMHLPHRETSSSVTPGRLRSAWMYAGSGSGRIVLVSASGDPYRRLSSVASSSSPEALPGALYAT